MDLMCTLHMREFAPPFLLPFGAKQFFFFFFFFVERAVFHAWHMAETHCAADVDRRQPNPKRDITCPRSQHPALIPHVHKNETFELKPDLG